MAERLSQTVANDLLAQITRGEYGAGDRLPSEPQLIDRCRVGRNTVREAKQGLRTLGAVDIRPRLGARVLGQAAPAPRKLSRVHAHRRARRSRALRGPTHPRTGCRALCAETPKR